MSTPYDAALRLRQREMDEIRVSITVQVNQMIVLDGQRDAIDTSVSREMALAVQIRFPADAFVARMRAERESLAHQRALSDAKLSALRAKAIEAYGSLSAIGAAVERHNADAMQVIALAEQSQIDDFSAARFTRTLAAARRLRNARDDHA